MTQMPAYNYYIELLEPALREWLPQHPEFPQHPLEFIKSLKNSEESDKIIEALGVPTLKEYVEKKYPLKERNGIPKSSIPEDIGGERTNKLALSYCNYLDSVGLYGISDKLFKSAQSFLGMNSNVMGPDSPLPPPSNNWNEDSPLPKPSPNPLPDPQEYMRKRRNQNSYLDTQQFNDWVQKAVSGGWTMRQLWDNIASTGNTALANDVVGKYRTIYNIDETQKVKPVKI